MKRLQINQAFAMLDQAFDVAPQAFSDKIDKTIGMLKDESSRKGFRFARVTSSP